MLTVDELLKNLSLGVFSNISLGLDGAGAIKADRIPNIIHYLNEGLTALHTEFVLSEKMLTLITFGNKSNYVLNSSNSFTGTNTIYDPNNLDPLGPNILDSDEEPFLDDIIKIMSVYSSTGYNLPINDLENVYSVFTPHSELLQVPNASDDAHLSIEYQANHPKIVGVQGEDSISFEGQTINIPAVLHSALYSYIAYKVYSHMNTPENTGKASEHLQLYTQTIQKVVTKDLVSESRAFSNTKFRKGGWI